jgi:hypothetical protein
MQQQDQTTDANDGTAPVEPTTCDVCSYLKRKMIINHVGNCPTCDQRCKWAWLLSNDGSAERMTTEEEKLPIADEPVEQQNK